MTARFYYQAVDAVGRCEKGQMAAQNVSDLEARLQQMGLDLTTAKMVKKTQPIFSSNKVSHRDLIMFCFQLEQLLTAGVPLLQSLNDLQENTEHVYFKTILGAIFSEVEGGRLLSEALSAYPTVFDAVFVNLIAAGEQSGQLPTVLHHLSNALKWQDALRTQTKRLLTYPLFICVVVMLAVIFLMVFLVPELVKFMDSLGQVLPWYTEVLIFISDACVHYWWLLISGPIALGVAVIIWLKNNQEARYQWDGLTLKLPLVGEVLHKIIMARFARYFALMYQAGIPVLQTIQTCETIVGNQVIANALHHIHANINAGERMSDSFSNVGLFPPLVIRMISIGEQAGALDQSLMQVSDFYDRDVDALLQRMLKMMEPALTVVLGLVLMLMVAAVLGPVYDAFSQMAL